MKLYCGFMKMILCFVFDDSVLCCLNERLDLVEVQDHIYIFFLFTNDLNDKIIKLYMIRINDLKLGN